MDNDIRIYRPRLLDQFIGQNLVRKNLEVFIQSAKERESSLACTLGWATWTWEDHLSKYYCERAKCKYQSYIRTTYNKGWRSCGDT